MSHSGPRRPAGLSDKIKLGWSLSYGNPSGYLTEIAIAIASEIQI